MSTDAAQKSQKIATALFQTGTSAMKQSNFDYAIDCFYKCAKLVPTNLDYRKNLRVAERKKFKENGKGAMMSGMKMAGAQMKLKAAKTRSKWAEVIESAEEALMHNPWDTAMQMEIGRACIAMEGMAEVGIWVMEHATQFDKKSADAFKLLGELYVLGEQFDKASSAYSTVKSLNPNDFESGAKAQKYAAEATFKKSEKAAAVRIEEENRPDTGEAEEVLTPEQRMRNEIAALEAKLAAAPKNTNLALQIGDTYKKIGEYEKAAEAYKKGFEASGDNEFKVKVAESRAEAAKKQLAAAQEKLAGLNKKAPDYADKVTKLKAHIKACNGEFINREAQVFLMRTQVNPEDYASYFEFGYRCLQLGKIDDAIKALQQGRNDSRHKWDALMWLGVAFGKKKNYTLAEKNLSEALDAVPQQNEDARKQVLYYRGCIAQEKGDKNAAADYFNEIAAIDYGYKDVSKRLDALAT